MDLKAYIQHELASLIDIRHDIHAHPETAYQEKRTSQLVQRELQRAGVTFSPGLARGTGILAHIPGPDPNAPAIALRADMDALNITEKTDLPWKSTISGKMHACGHDGHTTILIGTARILARIAREHGGLPRPVTFLFQPAEEGGAGGRAMIQDGALDGSRLGPPVEAIYGLHGWPGQHVGIVSTRPGPMLASADSFYATFTGRGTHAALPHLGNDPILAMSAATLAVQQIASRNVNPLDAIVVSVTQQNGGTANNVIPETAKLGGTVRTLNPDTRTFAQTRLAEIIDLTARTYGCTASFDYKRGYPVTVNHDDAAEIVRNVATETLGDSAYVPMAEPVMGAEDFSFYGQHVPACFFLIGLLDPDQESMPGLHHPAFDFNDDAFATGIEMMCRLALRS